MKHTIATLLLVLSFSGAQAQTGSISFDAPVVADTSNYVSYLFNNAGYQVYRPSTAFSLTADYGTGDAAGLVGQEFLGFCVNPMFSLPQDNTFYQYDTTGDVLSYDLDGAHQPGPDYWDVNQYIKYSALKDIFATYGDVLIGSDLASAETARLVTAIAFAIHEIVMDYDGTAGSLNLNFGLSQVLNTDSSQISGDALAAYESVASVIGTGVGSEFTLHAAGEGAGIAQDMVFFPIPEPSGALLVMFAGFGLMFRRRRLA